MTPSRRQEAIAVTLDHLLAVVAIHGEHHAEPQVVADALLRVAERIVDGVLAHARYSRDLQDAIAQLRRRES